MNKICPACGQGKPKTLEFFAPHTRDGFQNKCRDCMNRIKREKRVADPAYRARTNRDSLQRVRRYALDPVYREKCKIAAKKRYHENPEARAKHKEREKVKRLNRHGMTPEEKQTALVAQNHQCKICRSTLTRPHLDHNHAHCKGTFGCKECFRGYLCGNCNMMLGLAHDDPKVLRAAAEYVEAH